MGLRITEATDSELKEIYRLAGENRLEATNDREGDSRAKMIEDYEHAANYGAFFLCLKDDEETLIGWILVDQAFDYLTGSEVGWISDLYIKKDFRQKGYAELLLNLAFHAFKKLGYTDVRLNVYAHNDKAIKLYEKLGFKEISRFMKIDI